MGEDNPHLVGPAEVCRLLNISERHLGRLVDEGVLGKNDRGKYDDAECIKRFLAYQIELATNRRASQEELFAADIRLKKAKALNEELDHEERLGNLIHKDHIGRAWDAAIHEIKTAFLGFPPRYAPSLAACGSVSEVRDILDGAIRTVLDDLSKLDSRAIAPEPELAPAETPKPVDRKRVGGRKPKAKRGGEQ